MFPFGSTQPHFPPISTPVQAFGKFRHLVELGWDDHFSGFIDKTELIFHLNAGPPLMEFPGVVKLGGDD